MKCKTTFWTLLVSLRAPVSFGGRELDSSCVEVTAQWVCVKGDGEGDVGDGHDIWPENLVLSDCVRPRRRKCFGTSQRCCRLVCLRVGWMLMLGCDTPHSEHGVTLGSGRQSSGCVCSLSVAGLQRGGCMHDEAYSVTQPHQCS